ncbi:MAG: alpha/beta fold hydrolase [Microthrixaceae bacterium]|nr:alpha/beta fold hydrolase [Microthrixaceae bacterium]
MPRRLLIPLFVAALVAACSGNGLEGRRAENPETPTTTTTEIPQTTEPAPTTTSAPPSPESTTTTTSPASGVAPGPTASGFPPDWQPAPLQWSRCAEQRRFRCATLRVPRDWSRPHSGAEVTLAIAKLPASGKKIGTLFTNPGGPGASGLEFVFSEPFQRPLTERFDIVSWDPRGVGESTHLRCGSKVRPFLRQDSDPDNTTEQQAIDATAKALAEECGTKDADMLPFIGTDDTARDLEALRRAVGDEKLTYMGFSYGTFIGERYLAMFPSQVRAMVLDGVVNPTEGLVGLLTGQTTAMTEAIGRAFASCTTASCKATDPATRFRQAKSAVERAPLDTSEGPLGPSELATGAIYATYDPQLWSTLNRAIAQAATGNGDGMARLANGYYDIGDWTAYAGITCLDSEHPVGADAFRGFVERLRSSSPDFGGPIGNEMLPCAFWPIPPKVVTGSIRAESSPEVLVIGNTGDAATPYDDAVYVAAMLANGNLVTYHGEGHTSYGRDECIDDAVHRYLIDLVVPPEDPQCGGGGGGTPAP